MSERTNVRGQGRCLVIAEGGSNHGGSLDRALEMTRVAAECGAHAIKWQKRENHTLYAKSFYKSPYTSEHAYGPTYGEHREALEFGMEEFRELKTYAQTLGLTFLSTAFDIPSVNFLRELDCCSIKVASGSVTDTPLIEHIRDSGARIILSTGGFHLTEVSRAVEAAGDALTALLHCTAEYPASDDHLNLNCIRTYKDLWPRLSIGASLHGYGVLPGVMAYSAGAEVLEVHFTLDRTAKGTDNAFSLEPDGLKTLCRYLARAEQMMGDGVKRVYEQEQGPILKMAKSLRAASTLRSGSLLERRDILIQSPAVEGSLPPYHLNEILGRKLTRDLEEEEPIFLDDIA